MKAVMYSRSEPRGLHAETKCCFTPLCSVFIKPGTPNRKLGNNLGFRGMYPLIVKEQLYFLKLLVLKVHISLAVFLWIPAADDLPCISILCKGKVYEGLLIHYGVHRLGLSPTLLYMWLNHMWVVRSLQFLYIQCLILITATVHMQKWFQHPLPSHAVFLASNIPDLLGRIYKYIRRYLVFPQQLRMESRRLKQLLYLTMVLILVSYCMCRS